MDGRCDFGARDIVFSLSCHRPHFFFGPGKFITNSGQEARSFVLMNSGRASFWYRLYGRTVYSRNRASSYVPIRHASGIAFPGGMLFHDGQPAQRAGDRSYVLVGNVGVDLGRLAAGMSEKGLDAAQVRALSEEMRNEGVPQGMDTAFHFNPCFFACDFIYSFNKSAHLSYKIGCGFWETPDFRQQVPGEGGVRHLPALSVRMPFPARNVPDFFYKRRIIGKPPFEGLVQSRGDCEAWFCGSVHRYGLCAW